MKAILMAEIRDANAAMPPMDEGDLHLVYLVDGVRTGGWGLVGNATGLGLYTCFVWVHTSEEMLDAMLATGDYLFVEEIPDPVEAEVVATAGPDRELPGRAAVVQWLLGHGYSPALLNAMIPPGAPAHGVRKGLQDLHQVSELEYGRAR